MSKHILVILFLFMNTIIQILISLDDLFVNITFYSLLIILTIQLILILKSKKLELFDSVVFTFAYSFFYVSGLIQSNYGIFPNSLRYDPYYVARANLLIIIFQLIYIVTKVVLKSSKKSKNLALNSTKKNSFDISKKVFYFIFIFSLLIIIKDFDILYHRILYKQLDNVMSDTLYLIVTRTLYLFPLFLVFYLLCFKSKFKKFEYIFYLFFSSIMLIIVKNPIIERRNAIAPILLSLFIIKFQKNINNKKLIILNVFTMLILFNLAAIITNTDIGIANYDTLKFDFDFLGQFNTLHFDAYSEIISTTIFVDLFGITYGRQLLGVLLFFIPRTIWPTKPIGTGGFVGQALYNSYAGYNLNFFHISNPYISEGYINFGLLGIVIFAFALAYISFKLEQKTRYSFEWMIYLYISFYMYYFLRGDLISGFAYLIANLIALYFVPSILNKVFKKF